MKKVVSLLFLFSVVFFSSSAMAIDQWNPVIENGGEFFLSVGAMYKPEVIMESGDKPIKDWNWTTSNKDVASVWPDGSIIGCGYGTATLTGEAKDGSGKTAKIKATMKNIYTTHDSIIVDTPEGVDFGYILNASGINTVSSAGNCFSCEPLDDVNGINMCKIMPVKKGTDSLIFTSNGKRIKTVKITVKSSAFEEKAYTSPSPSPEPTPEQTDEPSVIQDSSENNDDFTVEHDEEYEKTKHYIWDFLEEKGYKVQTIIGTPNIGRYEDTDPDDGMEPWYAYVQFNGEWTEFVVMLYEGEVSMLRPNK